MRVADSYAAITDMRPYRPALNQEEARRHMAAWAGIEFDPRIVKALLSLDPLPELESFAVSLAEATATADGQPASEWNLFSSSK